MPPDMLLSACWLLSISVVDGAGGIDEDGEAAVSAMGLRESDTAMIDQISSVRDSQHALLIAK